MWQRLRDWLTCAEDRRRQERDHQRVMAVLDALDTVEPVPPDPPPSVVWRRPGDPWPGQDAR